MQHAIMMVRDALQGIGYQERGSIEKGDDGASYSLRMEASERNVTIFVQGSYANNTNIRKTSDVDVAVVCESSFFTEYRPGVNGSHYGFTKGGVSLGRFKDEVEDALIAKFGADVERHDKSIKVCGNSYRKNADVVAALRNRDYRSDYRNVLLLYRLTMKQLMSSLIKAGAAVATEAALRRLAW